MIPLLILLAAPGQYRSCQTAATYQQTYAAPTYYQQTYAAPFIEKTIFVAVQDPYFSNLVGQQARAELKAKAETDQAIDLATRVGQLADAVGRLEARIGAASPGQPPQPTGPPVAPTPDSGSPAQPAQPPPPPPTPVVPAPSAGGGQPPAAVLAILTRNCVKCHTTPSKAGGGFNLFGADGKLVALSPLDKILIDQQVYSGDMPKNALQPLGAEDYSQLRAWLGEDQAAIEAAVKACKAKGTN
jgi:hypothetical protein